MLVKVAQRGERLAKESKYTPKCVVVQGRRGERKGGEKVRSEKSRGGGRSDMYTRRTSESDPSVCSHVLEGEVS